MKILLINKFIDSLGGDSVYTQSLKELLDLSGHQTEIYGFKISSIDKNFFLKNPFNPIYPLNIKNKIIKKIELFSPDIIHVNNIHSYLSPIVLEVAQNKRIPVVWTLHDYKLVCPSYVMWKKGKYCEECLINSKYFNVIKNNCFESKVRSFISYIEAKYWSREKIEYLTSCFICPSKFLMRRMEQAGFPIKKLIHIPNFFFEPENINSNKSIIKDMNEYPTEYAIYVGALSDYKGILKYAQIHHNISKYPLIIIGDGERREEIVNLSNNSKKIFYLGKRDRNQVLELMKGAKYTVMPSQCNENNPLAIIESLTLGIPVFASNNGGIPEMINSENGSLFNSFNEIEVKLPYFEKSLTNFNINKIKTDSALIYSSDAYLKKIINIYSELSN
jgi:glycosyltransferase involved in cell wall biosynthesis